jgi:hypothetical protein
MIFIDQVLHADLHRAIDNAEPGAPAVKAPAVRFWTLRSRREISSARLLRHSRAIVLFVQSNACPLVRIQAPELAKLQTKYGEKGVLFWMITANPQNDPRDIIAVAKEFEISMLRSIQIE